jgi:hypothetical protein
MKKQKSGVLKEADHDYTEVLMRWYKGASHLERNLDAMETDRCASRKSTPPFKRWEIGDEEFKENAMVVLERDMNCIRDQLIQEGDHYGFLKERAIAKNGRKDFDVVCVRRIGLIVIFILSPKYRLSVSLQDHQLGRVQNKKEV